MEIMLRAHKCYITYKLLVGPKNEPLDFSDIRVTTLIGDTAHEMDITAELKVAADSEKESHIELKKLYFKVINSVVADINLMKEAWKEKQERTSMCFQCGKFVKSSFDLPFFKSQPDKKYDEHFCGCRGWD